MFKTRHVWTAAGLVLATVIATAQTRVQTVRPGTPGAGEQVDQIVGNAGFPVCLGDGTGAKCPANNPGLPGRGCENSAGRGGAVVMAVGFPSVMRDSLVLEVGGLPSGTTAIYMQGEKLAERAHAFGVGLMCLGGQITRVAMKRTDGMNASYPEFGDPTLSQAGHIPKVGGTVIYQVLYREIYNFNKFGVFNLSNAWWTCWVP